MAMWHYRYSRWDGSQNVEFLTKEDLIGHIADEVLQGHDLRDVLRRMMQKGAQLPQGQRMMGLQDLRERLRQARERRLQQYNLASVMDDIQERLNRVLDKERGTLEDRLNEAAQSSSQGQHDALADPGEETSAGQGSAEHPAGDMREMLRRIAQRRREQLNSLPPDVGGRIKGLRDYDFLDPEARQEFEELLQTLQQQFLQQQFQGLQQGLQNVTPEMLKQTAEMVRDLNELVRQKLQGQDPDITEFMQKWGHFFPPGIENFDQLIDYLEQQMAQMQSLLDSMPEDMRNQLMDMMEALLRDNRLHWDLMQLAANLEQLHPGSMRGNQFPFMGDDPLTLQEAMRVMGEMNSLDELSEEVIQAMRSNDASSLDAEEIGRLLGEEAQRLTEDLQRLTKMLEDAGFIRRKGNRWELTPQAIRKIGERALQDIFSKIRGGVLGDHNRERTGIGVELMDETKPYAFGDPLHLDALKTVSNAVLREGPGTPVRIKPQDFEVHQVQGLARCSTIIALDMSYSMVGTGYFQAGQRVGLALDTLIRTKYPKDQVTVLAFSYFVLPIKPEMILDTYWVEFGGGTNFQEVLRYSRRLLARQGGTTKQIIMITDGEPTTYSWSGAGLSDPNEDWIGRRRGGGVMEETLREVVRCTRDNVTINTFMMDHNPSLLRFVRLMTKVNRGRAFVASPDQLGTYVVADYVNMRNRVIR